MFASPADFSAVIGGVVFFGLLGAGLGLLERFLG